MFYEFKSLLQHTNIDKQIQTPKNGLFLYKILSKMYSSCLCFLKNLVLGNMLQFLLGIMQQPTSIFGSVKDMFLEFKSLPEHKNIDKTNTNSGKRQFLFKLLG